MNDCPDCEYKDAGEGYTDPAVTDMVRNSPVPINGWEWIADGYYYRRPCEKHRSEPKP